MKKLLFLVLLPVLLLAQNQYTKKALFSVGSDTISTITLQDTVQYRLWIDGVATSYFTLGTYVSAANKTAEATVPISLADDSNWSWAEYLDVKIYAGARNITSSTFNIGGLNGAVTLFLKPDTVGTNTVYSASVIGGN